MADFIIHWILGLEIIVLYISMSVKHVHIVQMLTDAPKEGIFSFFPLSYWHWCINSRIDRIDNSEAQKLEQNDYRKLCVGPSVAT